MSFSTPNSSFIFDLRRRSMRLWAVLRAIFFPATLVELGCFLGVVLADPPPRLPVGPAGDVPEGVLVGPGFIWMILRDLVGGGGREKSTLLVGVASCFCVLDVLRCFGPVVLATGDVGETGLYEDSDLTEPSDDPLLLVEARAGGGRAKVISNDGARAFSFAWRSVEDTGVGGRPGRGMMAQFVRGEMRCVNVLVACSDNPSKARD